MNFVGRITHNATVKTLKDDRKVVNFSVAINDYYKPKGSEKGVQVVTFLNCSYWISPTLAARLTKGALVEINGRIQVNPYKGFDGEAKASLNCHVNDVKIHQPGKSSGVATSQENNTTEQEIEDLPF